MRVFASLAVTSSKRPHRLEPSERQEVMAVVDALRDGIGAEAVGLFDDDRAQLHASSHPAHPNFWEAFGGLPCLEGDWSSWYLELRTNKRVDTTCACGAGHRLCGYLVHDRWALLVVAHASLIPGAAQRRRVGGEGAGRPATACAQTRDPSGGEGGRRRTGPRAGGDPDVVGAQGPAVAPRAHALRAQAEA
jgi:hypothetical protein